MIMVNKNAYDVLAIAIWENMVEIIRRWIMPDNQVAFQI